MQGRIDGGQGGHNSPGVEFLWGRRITAGAPNYCEGAEKSQQCHKYIVQYNIFASERPQVRTWGAKLASYPGRHLTSLLPCLVTPG